MRVETTMSILRRNCRGSRVGCIPLPIAGDRPATIAAFTILELLVVMTIIIVLAGLILATSGYVQKKGDRYLEVDPWRIVEKGFHKEQSKVSESLFCLSNENIGFRGSFEETYSGESLQGAYFNSLYEEKVEDRSGYRGISNRLCFMVNCPHALKLRLSIDGQELDLAKVAVFAGFNPTIDRVDFEKDFYPAIMEALFKSEAWIAIVMITDLLARKYRFNIPGTKANLNWTRRIRRSLAQLRSSPKERRRMRLIHELLVKTGRV